MTEDMAWPFCSRLTRFATGVCGLKNASQFVVIACSAEEEPEADGAAAAGDDGAEAGAELLLLVLPPLLHAARPPPTAETRRIQETNLRVFTQTFSSFLLSLAMLFLTLTSARRRKQWPAGTPECPRAAAFADDRG
jgi:hypothetical protein